MEWLSDNTRVIIRVSNSIGFVGVVALSIVTERTTMAGRTPEQIAELFLSPLTPVLYARNIWFLVYGLLGLLIPYQLLPAKRHSQFIYDRIGLLFFLVCLLDMARLVAYGFLDMWLAAMCSVCELVSVCAIYERLGINYGYSGRQRAPAYADLRVNDETLSATDYWLVQVPFSVMLGCLCMSTAANIAAAMVASHEHTVWSAATCSAIVLTVLTAPVAFLLNSRHDIFFGGAVAWGVATVAARHWSLTTLTDIVVATAASVNFGLMMAGVAVSFATICWTYVLWPAPDRERRTELASFDAHLA